jgi:membrane-bound lytic murein transglycosylase D
MLKTKRVKPGFLTQAGLLLLVTPSMAYMVHASAFAQSPLQGRETVYVAAVSSNSFNSEAGYYERLSAPDAPKIGLQPQAKSFVQKYLLKNKKDLLFIARQRNDQFKMIESVFAKHGLPLELKYLAMVESDLKSNAVSRSGAVGMWQLMPETARNFGLKIKGKTDERRNAYRSTVAAAKYLKSLYGEFHDWLLVIAAYNGGSGRVLTAMKKSGSKSFWAMKRFLPAETRGHVEHFISVHYLLEEKGSVVTLTRSETVKHFQSISDYLSRKSCELPQLPATETVVVAEPALAKEED